MEEQVDGEGAEVEEGGQEAPVLRGYISKAGLHLGAAGEVVRTDLRLHKYGAVAVEELERSQDLALHQAAHQDCRRRPPSCADGHLPEPCLQRDEPVAAHYLVHGCGVGPARRNLLCRGVFGVRRLACGCEWNVFIGLQLRNPTRRRRSQTANRSYLWAFLEESMYSVYPKQFG